MAGNVIRGERVFHAGERDQTIQRAAVKEVPSRVSGKRAAYGAFTRAARAIDGYDACGGHSSICNPTARALSRKSGNEVATLAVSRISIAARARTLAMAKAIAMRWSPWVIAWVSLKK